MWSFPIFLSICCTVTIPCMFSTKGDTSCCMYRYCINLVSRAKSKRVIQPDSSIGAINSPYLVGKRSWGTI